ncbi:putative prefoldin subunit protein [Eutypa lata UCREL1]|uniref:Putative prefoldin subunit protein n=1 Tax=Eutypa lata (strain UCR-EL1) TaxID=1287681 RepID=M7SUK9_EUTLA|nr:putative prefoldin subunit protein [Eutypa lata UCREL1]
MAEIQAKLQALSEDYQKLQDELQTAVQSRQKLEAQRQENLGVRKEFNRMKEGESIYKLVGPVLLKQEKPEAESTVNGRLEFINKEIERIDKQIKEVQEKIERKKGDIIQAQAGLQAAGAGGAPGQVAAKA